MQHYLSPLLELLARVVWKKYEERDKAQKDAWEWINENIERRMENILGPIEGETQQRKDEMRQRKVEIRNLLMVELRAWLGKQRHVLSKKFEDQLIKYAIAAQNVVEYMHIHTPEGRQTLYQNQQDMAKARNELEGLVAGRWKRFTNVFNRCVRKISMRTLFLFLGGFLAFAGWGMLWGAVFNHFPFYLFAVFSAFFIAHFVFITTFYALRVFFSSDEDARRGHLHSLCLSAACQAGHAAGTVCFVVLWMEGRWALW